MQAWNFLGLGYFFVWLRGKKQMRVRWANSKTLMKNAGKPCTGKPCARFGEGGLASVAMVEPRSLSDLTV